MILVCTTLWCGCIAPRTARRQVASSKAWYELEDEDGDCDLGMQLLSRVLTLGAKRNWLASQARGAVHANFDDDDVYWCCTARTGPVFVVHGVAPIAGMMPHWLTLC